MGNKNDNEEIELEKRLEELGKIKPITDDAELMSALNRIISEEIESKHPNGKLIDRAVEFMLALQGKDIKEIEKDGERAKKNFFERLRSGELGIKLERGYEKPKKRVVKLFIAVALSAILMAVGAFGVLRTLDIDLMNIRSFLGIERNVVHEDGKHSLVISDNMLTYYESVDEMMEKEGLDSILLPDCEIKQIMVYTDANGIKRVVFDMANFDFAIRLSKNNVFDQRQTEKIGNFHVIKLKFDNKIQGEWIYENKKYSVITETSDNLIEIIENVSVYKK